MSGVSSIPSFLPQAEVTAQRKERQVQQSSETFEAMMLSELLKPMQNAFTGGEDGDNALTSYGVDALAEGMAHAGGIGIARQLEMHLRTTMQKDSSSALKKSEP